ncbi:MAG: sensor histidine kinase [Oscillospiraceae bacterium]
MRFFKDMKFWKKVTLICGIPLLLISMLIGAMSYTRAKDTARSSSKLSLYDAVNRMDISLTTRSRQIISSVEAIAEGLLSADALELPASHLRDICLGLVAPFQEVQAVTVIWEGQPVYRSDPSLPLSDQVINPLIAQAQAHPGKVVWSDVLTFPESGDAILLARELQAADGRGRGTLLLRIDPYAMGNMLLSKQKNLSRQVSVHLDRSFRPMYQTGSASPELLEQIVAQYRAGNRSFSFSLDGLSYYCSTQYNGLVGWYTCSFVEESNLFPGAAALRDYIILLVILCAVAAYILLWFLSRSITRPLDQLNSAMKTVQYKHLNVSLDVKSRDEIGELTESFNYMMGRIHTLVNRVYEEKLAQKNAEIEALQAQINPHFLYNTLDSINWMLIDRDELDISSVVVSLGKLMQYSMDTSSALVPLHMEYRNALDYLNIQKNRLEDRLLYELDLPSDLEDFLIPRLILQPLIENAIIHGILPSGRSGRITVRTRQEGSRLVLSVQDNGDGMEPMQLQQLRQLLSGSQESGSIGMRNVARRLQLHFDGQCRFSVDSGPGRGTTVRLLLPMQGRRMNF